MKDITILIMCVFLVGCGVREEPHPADPSCAESPHALCSVNDAISESIQTAVADPHAQKLLLQRRHLQSELMMVEALLSSEAAQETVAQASVILFDEEMSGENLARRREALRLALSVLERIEYQWRAEVLLRTKRNQEDAQHQPAR